MPGLTSARKLAKIRIEKPLLKGLRRVNEGTMAQARDQGQRSASKGQGDAQACDGEDVIVSTRSAELPVSQATSGSI